MKKLILIGLLILLAVIIINPDKTDAARLGRLLSSFLQRANTWTGAQTDTQVATFNSGLVSGQSGITVYDNDSPPSGNTVFSVDGAGNVVIEGTLGVGTATPGVKVDIVGSGLRFRDGATSDMDFTATSTGGVINLRDGSGNAVINLDARDNGNDNYINHGGDFGFGLMTPSSKVEILGSGASSSTTGFNVASSSGTSNLTILDDGLIYVGATLSNDVGAERPLIMDTANGELGYNSSSARAKINITGIGSTSWIYNLEPKKYEKKKQQRVFWETLVPIPGGKWDEQSGTTIYNRTIQHSRKVYLEEGTGTSEDGLIAEDVALVNPEYVFFDASGVTPEAINYSKLVVPLIAELIKLRDRIVVLEALHP